MVLREIRYLGGRFAGYVYEDDMDYPERRRDDLVSGPGPRGSPTRDYDEEATNGWAAGWFPQSRAKAIAEADTRTKRGGTSGRGGARGERATELRHLNDLMNGMGLGQRQSRAGPAVPDLSRVVVSVPSYSYDGSYSPSELPKLKKTRTDMLKKYLGCEVAGDEKGLRKAEDNIAMIDEDIAIIQYMEREANTVLPRNGDSSRRRDQEDDLEDEESYYQPRGTRNSRRSTGSVAVPSRHFY